jgi:hypothetical protein
MRHLKFILTLAGLALPSVLSAATAAVLGWNNLGMHCMDSDYSVFSVLPPYNTIECQLIVAGRLVTNGAGYTVTYQAVADPSGSFNSTAMGKGNFYDYSLDLYGASLAPEAGLKGWGMPGASNTPLAMVFENANWPAPSVSTPVNWFRAEGIPITPFDDAHNKNPYPLMRIVARNASNQAIATNDVVLPVSDEMDCRACHASGTQAAARPASGWVWNGLPERDYRLNILRLHDQHQFAEHLELYTNALAARHFNPAGLYRSVTVDHKPVLCAACHASEALGAPSYGTIPPLTASVHGYHAHVMDPLLGTPLEDAGNRSACYRCHPGSETRCLRGAMGGAIGADGKMAMQCQSCHGTMSQVGDPGRVGWFMEPNCQACHTGTATSNSGEIRYTSAFTNAATAGLRIPANRTFATQSNTPAPDLSLYRFSAGHGGLQCSACHGSTHAEFPGTHLNDNLRNIRLQGHAGTTVECTACHVSMSAAATTVNRGPHGMHPLGQTIVEHHPDLIERGSTSRAECQACHGTNYCGSVLARAQDTRTVTSKYGTKTYWRGQQVGCYDCHDGVFSSNPTMNTSPFVSAVSTNTLSGASVAMTLPGSDADSNPLTFRIVSQPAHGSVGISGNTATYFADAGYVGPDQFTFAANDTYSDSNLSTGKVDVAQGPVSITAHAQVPPSYPSAWPTPFAIVPSVVNSTSTPSVSWTFGDGSPSTSGLYPTHTYANPGSYQWSVTCSAGGATVIKSGVIQITAPMRLTQTVAGEDLTISWPATLADVILESSPELGMGAHWSWVTEGVVTGPNEVRLPLSLAGNRYYRINRPW